MKYIIVFTMLFLSTSAMADYIKKCGEIERFRIWVTGSDTYGFWVEYENNPESCPGGFYLPHVADNKDYVVSFLLAEKAQKHKICMQVDPEDKISNRCRINYVYNP